MRINVAFACMVLFSLVACGSQASPSQPAGGASPFIPNIVDAPAPAFASPLPAEQVSPEPTRALIPPESLTTVELHQRLDPFSGWMPDCALPCYNGLIAGQSITPDVYDFYSRLGIGLRDLIPGDYPGIADGTGLLRAWLTKSSDVAQAAEMGLAPPVVSISVVDNVAEIAAVGWEYSPPYLTAPILLQQIGQPDQIDLALVFTQEPPAYLLHFYYTEENTGFGFTGETVTDASALQVCLSPDQIVYTAMNIFASDLDPMETLSFSHLLLPVEGALGIPAADLAARITAGECFSVPASAWPNWQSMDGNQSPQPTP